MTRGSGLTHPARRFVNLKAEYYQALADALERDQLEGLSDETTLGQLASILYEIDSQGRMKIESKAQAAARGVPSPDRAEALMLAFCKPPIKFEYHSIRDLPRLQSSTSYDPADYPNHDDDYPWARGRRDWEAWAPGSLARYFRKHRGGF